MSFQIIGDSCCDYPYPGEDYNWLERVPLTIELEGKTYIDDKTLRSSELITKMKASLTAPKSACPSPGRFAEALDCGADDIYVVTLSDKVSGTYNSAVVGANMFLEDNPNKNVFVFSSNSAASGEIAVCNKIYDLASSGMTFDEVVKETLEFIRNMSTFFILETLDVFRKNGRLNHLQSIVTGALRMKLVMGADEYGKICVKGKALSIDRAISKMANQISEICLGKDMSDTTLYITQCQCPDRARKTRDIIMKKVNFKDCVILRAGGISTIYANAGGQIVCF